MWLCQRKEQLSTQQIHQAELRQWPDVHLEAARDAPSSLQWPLVLSKDAGSGPASSSSLPHLSVIKVTGLSLQQDRQGGFFQAPGPGLGASTGAGAQLGACWGEPRGTGCSSSACPAPSQEKLRHRLPWLRDGGIRATCSSPHCKPDTLG